MDPTVESALIGVVAAVVGVGGTVIVAITSARNSRRTNQATIDAAHVNTLLTLETAREAQEATRDAQFADRYSRALEQLGSTNLDVRIGGIYALEGIAFDSPRHHPTVMEVLTAFIREHSPILPEWDPDSERKLLPDVQAALTVIGRRNTEHDHDRRKVNLNGTNLGRAYLVGANLSKVLLQEANLYKANLKEADLTEANLFGANLDRTGFLNAKLPGADLIATRQLTHAIFAGADLDLTDTKWPPSVEPPKGWTRADSSEGIGTLKRAPAPDQ